MRSGARLPRRSNPAKEYLEVVDTAVFVLERFPNCNYEASESGDTKDVPQGAKPRERGKENYDGPNCDEYGVNCRGVGCFSFLRACGLILIVFQSKFEMVEPFVLLKQPFLFFG